MTKPTASADGGAMPDERPTLMDAIDAMPDERPTLSDLIDELNVIRDLNEVARLAAGSADAVGAGGPIQTLLDVIDKKLADVRYSLGVIDLQGSEANHG